MDVLAKGRVLAVAPEGTRSHTAELQEGKAGVAYLATRIRAPIVPVSHWGVEKLGLWKRLKRPRCRVVIGKPFHLPEFSVRPNTAELQKLADYIMLHIALGLPPAYRGVYAERTAAVEAGEAADQAFR
jgi:1-acyl-sn-glycerol-3-phosphate acyltransferase